MKLSLKMVATEFKANIRSVSKSVKLLAKDCLLCKKGM